MGAVVDSAGKFSLSWLPADGPTQVSVVTAWGPARSDHAALLDAALGSGVSAPSNSSRELHGAYIADAAGSGRAVLALDVEAGSAADGSSSAAVLAAAVSDVVLLSLPFHDVDRAAASGIAALAAAISLAKEVSASAPGAAGSQGDRGARTLLICIRDWDDEEASVSDVLPMVKDQLDSVGLSDSVSFEILPLSSRFLAKDKFVIESAGLRSQVTELLSSPATINPIQSPDLETDISAIWKVLEPATDSASSTADASSSGQDREVTATVQATAIMTSVFDKYLADVRAWKQGIEAGRVLGDFGRESSQKLEKTLTVYDTDAKAIKTTTAFARKRTELKDRVESDLHSLYTKQVLLLRELAYEKFKQSLSGISVSSRVERDVRKKITEAQAFFTEKAEELKARNMPWRSDNERRELVSAMNDNATERLQLARLQGSYTPGNRTPIALGVHWLHPHPFGKDSRFEKLSVDDYVQYDPERAKKASIGRLRPFAKGSSYDVTDGIGTSSEFNMIYSDSRDS